MPSIFCFDALNIFCPCPPILNPWTINRQVIKTYHAGLQPQATAGKLRFQPSSPSLWVEFLPWTPMGIYHHDKTARTEQSPCRSATPALNSTKHAGLHWWHWQLVLMLMMLTMQWVQSAMWKFHLLDSRLHTPSQTPNLYIYLDLNLNSAGRIYNKTRGKTNQLIMVV